ncbi:MAG: AmmeMemoRadiSam system protein B [Planctomycetota bacterium]|nr:MAG: AmmeMemoRadiSam system protein B [Planctomycetota bacterium]
MSEEKPCVRPLDVVPVQTGKQMAFVLRDPEGLTNEVMVISPLAFYLMALMDGSRGVLDIQVDFARRFGTIIPSEKIEELVSQLDKHHLLENDSYRSWRNGIIEEFRKAPLREARFAGSAYPAETDPLKKMLASFFEGVESALDAPPCAVVAPHIDLQRGRGCFAAAYSLFKNIPTPATFVLLGTCHTPMQQPFCLTKKDFKTPLGVAKNDAETATKLLDKMKWLGEDEFSHRGEHSIEFQVLFLQHLFDSADFRILPVLCGGFHRYMEKGESPAEDERVREFLDAMRDALSGVENPVLIAGADLSHIGRRFGDGVTMQQSLLDWLREQDQKVLTLVEKGDANGLFEEVAKERDARRICGLPPIWTLLELLPAGASGRIVKYEQSVEQETDSVVTFAALAWRHSDG